jgi:hypothetical protein
VHLLEPPGQQRQLILSEHVELLIWQRHLRGQAEHPGGWVSIKLSFRATDEQCCRKRQCSPCTHRVNATQQTFV